MTTREFEKWIKAMDSKPETKGKLDLVSPMIANIGVEAQKEIKDYAHMFNIDPDGLLMWYAYMMIGARELGIEKIEKGETENAD